VILLPLVFPTTSYQQTRSDIYGLIPSYFRHCWRIWRNFAFRHGSGIRKLFAIFFLSSFHLRSIEIKWHSLRTWPPDIQRSDTQHNDNQLVTLTITTFSETTLNVMPLKNASHCTTAMDTQWCYPMCRHGEWQCWVLQRQEDKEGRKT